VCDLAVGLALRGHDVTLHCAEGSEVEGVELVTVPAPLDAVAALVMPGGPPPPPSPGVAAALAEIFANVRAWRADAVSQHAFDAPALELATDLPALHTLHLPPIVPAVVSSAMRVPHGRLATVSRSCLGAWRRAGIAPARLLPNGVPEQPSPAQPVEPFALVAGRISPEKGIEDAIAAARSVGLPVRVAGAHYDPAYAIDLRTVDVLGPLPRRELRLLMAQAAVTVCAVRWEEPFGMVAAEAQMAGCPVAAYRRGAMPEVIEDGVSGCLAEPDDAGSLAQAIARCLDLDRAAARASAARRLGLDAALDRYETALAAAAR
jgi:glycosyltransferase involved in cell wall biosynthesis